MAKVATELLDRMVEESGAKVEIDAEGIIILTPASDPHVIGVSRLLAQLIAATPDELLIVAEGPRWAPLGGDKPSYVPDLGVVVVAALRRRGTDDFTLNPPPLLVVEVLSPESRRRDLTEKADAYWQGGAGAYWTLELEGATPVNRPTLTIRQRGQMGWEASAPRTGSVHITAPFEALIDLDRLAL